MNANKILDKMEFKCSKSKNQRYNFTPYHTRYNVIITYNGKRLDFYFQCNQRITPTLKSCISSVILDADSYEDYQLVDEFAYEFGYTDYKEAVRIHNACMNMYLKLKNFLTDEERFSIRDILMEEGLL